MADQRQQHLINTARFTLALKRAFEELGPDAVFQLIPEVYGQKRLADARTFLVRAVGVWCLVVPPSLITMRVWLAVNHIDGVQIPESMIYWVCFLGIVSILAFGFDLVNPQTLLKWGLRKPPPKGTHEILMSKSGHFTTLTDDGDIPDDLS